MSVGEANPLFSSIRDLGEAIKNYESLQDVDEGRKIFPAGDGSFSVSPGYNKGITWIIQFVSRNLSLLFGYDATALGTKEGLEGLNEKTFSNLTGLIECVDEKCKDSLFFVTSVKTELIALKSVIAKAKDAINTLSKTYESENDDSMAKTTKREAEKCENLIKFINTSIARFSSESVQNNGSPATKTSVLSKPAVLMKLDEKTADELIELFEEKLNSSTIVPKEVFVELFAFQFSFKELTDIKYIRIGEPEKVLLNSRIEEKLDKWKEILNSTNLENSKANFNLAFDEVYKPQALGNPSPKEFSTKGNVMQELKASFKIVE